MIRNSFYEVFISQNNIIKIYVPILFYFLIVTFSIINSFYGFDITDEGLYIALGYRVFLGDKFIIDEIFNKITFYHYFYYIIFKLFGDNIPLIYIRILGVLLNSLPYILFYIYFQKKVNNIFLLIVLSIPFLTNTFVGMRMPGYNSISTDLALLSLGLHLLSFSAVKRKNKIVLAIASGTVFFLAIVSYITLLFFLIIPFFYLIYQKIKKKDRDKILVTKLFLFTSTLLTIVVYSYVFINYRNYYNEGLYTNNIFLVVYDMFKNYCFLLDYSNIGFVYIFISVIITIYLLFNKTEDISKFSIFIIISLIFYIIFKADVFRFNLVLIFVFTVFFIPIFIISLRDKNFVLQDEEMLYSLALSLGLMLIYSLSTTHLYFERTYVAGYQGITLFIVFLMVSLYKFIKKYSSHLINLIFVIMVGFVFLNSLKYNKNYIYRDDKRFKLNATFNDVRLKGIYTTEQRAKTIDSLIVFVRPKIERGDYLLAYPTIPMINYLTKTRPATNFVWMDNTKSKDFKNKLIDYMHSNNRIPKICVVMYSTDFISFSKDVVYDFGDDPIVNYIEKNYEKIKTIGPFYVYEKKDK